MILPNTDPLIAQIAENQEVLVAPSDTYAIAIPGYSELQVRERGAFTLQALLTDSQVESPANIFYCERDTTTPKLTASHPMTPVGPYDGPGGQHGPARWVDYELQTTLRSETASTASMQLHAYLPGPASLSRYYKLTADELVVDTSVLVHSGQEVRTSLGHHDYYLLGKEEDIHDLTINSQTLDELLYESGATEAIMKGEARFWSDFSDGNARVRFPNGQVLDITARADLQRKQQTGMLLWHRPKTPSICLEPTIGVVESDGVLDMRALHLGGTAAYGAILDVSIKLINSGADTAF